MHLKNLETNQVYNVPKEMAESFVQKDRKIFKIIDEGYKPADTTVVETPMFDLVVEEEKKDSAVDSFIDDVLAEDIDSMGRKELRDLCKLKGIKYSVTYSADKLRELIKG